MSQLWSRREWISIAATGVAMASGLLAAGHTAHAQNVNARNASAPKRTPNVLFIAVDDLRPTLGCYGDKIVKSPNIDKLAASGTLFQRAYCQQAVCSPSRNSLLSGLRPDSIKIYDLATNIRTALPNVVTLPQHFKAQGYRSERLGKIFHTTNGNHDDPLSWSEPQPVVALPDVIAPHIKQQILSQPEVAQPGNASPPQVKKGPPFGAPEVADDALPDGKIASQAIASLGANKNRPFFLAVGFHKPHLPFVAPRKYWDLYDRAQFKPHPLRNPPLGAPGYAGNGIGELRQYRGIPKKGPIPDEQAVQLIHGYHAAISYMDAQVGRVLDELDRLGLRDNTIVVLWGDHGWQLGEHGKWCKHNNYEAATHSPLLVRAPGVGAPGQQTNALTEFVDIYPSLCELAGLPQPQGLEGTSFVPLLRDPKRAWKQAAFSQWPQKIPDRGDGMGYAMRTDRYRFIEWTVPGTDFSEVELYDYQTDPAETVNIATQPQHAKLVAELKALLRAGPRAALPPRQPGAASKVGAWRAMPLRHSATPQRPAPCGGRRKAL